MNINNLKNFDADRVDLEELVALHAFGAQLQLEYSELGIEEPDWLTLRVKEIRREIRTRLSDNVEKRIRETRARLDQLKTPGEKKRELQAELDKLEKMQEVK